MNTENLDAEYSVLFLLFSKEKYNVYRRLVDVGLTSEYFSVILHRKIAKYIMDFLHRNEKYSIKSFGTYFASVEPEESVVYERFVDDVKTHSCTFDDLDLNVRLMCECYATRKLFKTVNECIDNKKGKSTLELVQDIKQRCNVAEQILESDKKRRKMGLKSGLKDRIDRAQKVHDDPDNAGMIMTGLKNIDKWIGRQTPGDLCIYQARTGKGKSMMLMGTAIANFKRGLKVMVVTIEMSDYDYLYRFDSNLTGIEHREFTQGEIVVDGDKVKLWKRRINNTGKDGEDLNVYWVPANCTPATIEQLVEDNDYKPDLLIVDYAGDMSSGLSGVPDLSAQAQGEVYSGLKRIAGKYECVVYTAQQSIRGTKAGRSSTETGAWTDRASQLATLMLAVEVTREDEDFMTEVNGDVVIGRMTVSVIKGRNAPCCKTHIIPRFARMSWLEKEETEMIPCGAGREIPTEKKKAQQAEQAMDKKIEEADNAEDEEIDILSGE